MLLVVLGLVGAACAGCSRGDDSAAGRVVAQRAAQARSAAIEAGLGDDVADVVALAARAPAATFSAVYEVPGVPGRVVVHQRPPRRRVDTVDAEGRTVSAFVSDGSATSWDCTRRTSWRCAAVAGSSGAGAFDPALVDRTVAALSATGPTAEPVSVERTTVAGAAAVCVRSGATERLCVSPSGVPLLVERAGAGSLRAVTYRTAVDPDDLRRPDR